MERAQSTQQQQPRAVAVDAADNTSEWHKATQPTQHDNNKHSAPSTIADRMHGNAYAHTHILHPPTSGVAQGNSARRPARLRLGSGIFSCARELSEA